MKVGDKTINSNCLVWAIVQRLKDGGEFAILKWGNPFPHFCVIRGDTAIHFKAANKDLSWWKQFWFAGTHTIDFIGDPRSKNESR